ncbi:hypothetical protein ACFFX1_55475 [Dactylosporangium sucinum]|uniref:Uncharacterized protein n=1 Tax=Dactylosporangium sucinum TaxID=1424081 RepID=A0A917U3L5_9ACTN|nr:hypothetical protein [Dactylosporangium sucinum]GGM52593.1 hypothetical protein GCM10007977_062690 [Dactylosporangium sucinum]
MSTLADIRKAAESEVHTWPSDSAPGHFVASTVIVGLVTDYLCAGDVDDAAPIVGRIEWQPTASLKPPSAYRGAGIKGGQPLTARWEYATEAFKAMVEPV